MNIRGKKATKKDKKPEFIMLYVNPLKIFNNICPLKIFAANLNPNETFLAKYEINSIRTNRANKPRGQPEGTNKEKNFNLWKIKPKIVAPKTTVKLKEKAKIKCEVLAKLYGTIPIKLLHRINKNKV